MRFEQYKFVRGLNESLEEAIKYMFVQQNLDLVNDCVSAIDAITLLFQENKQDILKLSLIPDLNNIRKSLIDASILQDLEELLDSVAKFKLDCELGISYKYKILFVAELESKWDSMDSVYRAFLSRKDCEVDVVLEPIFRATKLPDGNTRSEIIYDDYLTPMGINNIPYTQYNISKVCPDITLISQPYEGVTIPELWPENIAKYSRVVYLPYYDAISANEMVAPATVDTNFKMPVQRVAWKIACQSEEMYHYFEKFSSLHGDNVMVTGIPKWDYPINMSKIPCPKDWESKLQDKKVILWNTHFAMKDDSFISHGMELIDIINDSKDLALIWRPHPMTEAVIKVHRPEMLPYYLDLKNRILKADNMVVDTNGKYDAAFIYSDMLFTDISSLLNQYMFLNKPILIYLPKSEADYKDTLLNDKYGMFDFNKFPIIDDVKSCDKYLESMLTEPDRFLKSQDEIMKVFYKYADGHVGERVAGKLIEDFVNEEL